MTNKTSKNGGQGSLSICPFGQLGNFHPHLALVSYQVNK